jgi:hypothetical protein
MEETAEARIHVQISEQNGDASPLRVAAVRADGHVRKAVAVEAGGHVFTTKPVLPGSTSTTSETLSWLSGTPRERG